MEVLEYMVENSGYIMEKFLEHIFIFLASWSMAVVAGVAIGIFVTRPGHRRAGNLVLSITGATQAVPSIAVIALVFLFMGIGAPPAVVALFLYSLVPVVFNTASGLMNVSMKMKEAAKGMGMTNRQVLWKVEKCLSQFQQCFRELEVRHNKYRYCCYCRINWCGWSERLFSQDCMTKGPMIIAGAIPVTILAIAVDIILGVFSEKRPDFRLPEHRGNMEVFSFGREYFLLRQKSGNGHVIWSDKTEC